MDNIFSMELKVGLTLFILFLLCSCKPTNTENIAVSDDVKETDLSKSTPIDSLLNDETTAIDLSSENDVLNIDNFNETLLEQLLEVEINNLRSQIDLPPLFRESILTYAARDQNLFQVQNSQMSHIQDSDDKRSVSKRIHHFGGNFRWSGENVQYLGFVIYTDNYGQQVKTNTYKHTAIEIAENWKRSPGHYGNIINNQFKFVGTSIALDLKKQALYATQVFGG